MGGIDGTPDGDIVGAGEDRDIPHKIFVLVVNLYFLFYHQHHLQHIVIIFV